MTNKKVHPKKQSKKKPPRVKGAPRNEKSRQQSLLETLRAALAKNDRIFLQRQLTYHVIGSTSLPDIKAPSKKLFDLLNALLLFAAGRSPARNKLEICLERAEDASQQGVAILLLAKDGASSSEPAETSLAGIADINSCQKLVEGCGGALSYELLPHDQVRYRLFFPVESARQQMADGHRHYRYDIQITGFLALRKRYGVRKCAGLVHQVLHVVRSMVREPDTLLENADVGTVTLFYETGEEGASSVSSRISQRLVREAFRIGKKREPIAFRYQLSVQERGR